MTPRSTSTRTRLAAATLACGLCLGAAAPQAFAADLPQNEAVQQIFQDLIDDDVLRSWAPGTTPTNDLLAKVIDEDAGPAIVIVTPGTDDTGLHPRIDRIVGTRDAAYIKYPESFGPIIAGRSDAALGLPFLAPGYVKSRTVAEQNNLAVMEALKDYGGVVVYTGYSQGAEALGNAAEQGKDELGPNTLILLVSDPRSPWGIKGWAKDLPFSDLWVTPGLGLLGVDNDGARDPGDTGEVNVVSVIMRGDPVADWQWKWHRPVSSLLVNGAGFLAIHSPGDGPYGHLDCSENKQGVVLVRNEGCAPKILTSADGNTTYAIYDTYHPLALFNALLYDAVGIKYDTKDLERWNTYAEAFYPMEDVTEKGARDGVKVAAADSRAADLTGTAETGTHTQSLDQPVAAQSEPTAEVAGKHRLMGQSGDWVEPQDQSSGYVPRHGKHVETHAVQGDDSGVLESNPDPAPSLENGANGKDSVGDPSGAGEVAAVGGLAEVG
ncbi:PE-PPE domain-containing protein [Gordonia iterans]|uniref:PE-PPE domain-containing protein n=1 Tax=Gordonia iterans TaxID=1004901 RepID=A0A2S0KJ55_9ACTN|nr:PE-PPE domain-containing protein [Gordonia iterans]AVM01686.1 PE-PPE domain-containing protein [Gordonia iterans]